LPSEGLLPLLEVAPPPLIFCQPYGGIPSA